MRNALVFVSATLVVAIGVLGVGIAAQELAVGTAPNGTLLFNKEAAVDQGVLPMAITSSGMLIVPRDLPGANAAIEWLSDENNVALLDEDASGWFEGFVRDRESTPNFTAYMNLRLGRYLTQTNAGNGLSIREAIQERAAKMQREGVTSLLAGCGHQGVCIDQIMCCVRVLPNPPECELCDCWEPCNDCCGYGLNIDSGIGLNIGLGDLELFI